MVLFSFFLCISTWPFNLCKWKQIALDVPLIILSTDTEINLWVTAWYTTDFFQLPVKKNLPAIQLSPLSGLLTERLMPLGTWPLCGHMTQDHHKPWKIYWITASRSYTSTEQRPTLNYITLLWPLANFLFTASCACKSPTIKYMLKWALQGKLWPNRRALQHHSTGETVATEKGNVTVAGNTNLKADQLTDDKKILLPI